MYEPIERPADHIFEHYSLSLIYRETNRGGAFFSELVAVDGRILKLFMTNENEILILGNADEVPIEIKDEYDDEDYDECCDSSCFIDDEPNIECDSNDTDGAIPAIPNQVETVTQLTFDF
ncbi:hypothetical protein [Aquamicrobium sp.]|uniref:hypothetical protein n=1 Tax=Aquamicrobium sp. TaxID=1872579 RepID=UPI00258CB84A|nr:hypothetical protein [Aquamicrobium sp.]MCK9551157.1 hypothetical protein [Aquamicrobium sp.]